MLRTRTYFEIIKKADEVKPTSHEKYVRRLKNYMEMKSEKSFKQALRKKREKSEIAFDELFKGKESIR